MATKVKPTRLNVTWVPQVGKVPTYVDKNTFEWWEWWGVVWPNSSTDWNIALFDGATWKIIKDSGVSLSSKQDTLTAWNWIDITSNKISTTYCYWESTTAAATVQKEVSIPSITELNVWQQITVKPSVTATNWATSLKLNDFTAYPIRYNNAALTSATDWYIRWADYLSTFLFDWSYWQVVSKSCDVNSTYTLNQLIDAWRYKAWVGTYAITRYSLCMMKADGTWEKITATNAAYSTWTSKTVNTNWFVLNQIKYYNTTTNVAGGAFVATNTFVSQAATVTLAYSFNCGTAPWRSVWIPIYIVGTIWADGLFYLDTTARWTTTLPSTKDWKLYIRIWTALAADNSTASFLQDRPIFYYDNWIKEYVVWIKDNLTSTSTIDALSANQWKILNDKINDLFGQWKFLSLWDATTWMPISFPLSIPYSYSTWDYFLVETVSSATPPVNYRPNGSSYAWTASSTPETDELEQWDVYIYDGAVWLLQSNHWKTVTFANIAWDPYDNTNLSTALWDKQDALVSWTTIRTINWTSILWSWDIATPTWIPSQTWEAGKFLTTDWTSVSWWTVSAWVTSVNWQTWAVTVNEVPTVWTNGQVLTVVSWAAAWANAAWSDYSWVTKTISWWEIELWLRTIVNVPTSNFTLTAPATLKDWEEYAIRIISETSYTMTLWTWFTNPRNVNTTLSWNATDQYVFLAINGELELQPLVDTWV